MTARDFLAANDPELLRRAGFQVPIGRPVATNPSELTKRRRKLPGVIQPESDLQDECATWLREFSGIPNYVIRPDMRRKVVGLPPGHPDFTIFLRDAAGRPTCVLIECKRADVKGCDPDQLERHAELRAAGHEVSVCRSLAEFIQAVKSAITPL